MDDAKAQQMAEEHIGTCFDGWRIDGYVNHGKSAAIFRATKAGQSAALKLFDPELSARFGRDAQLERIRRETSLVGKSHPNLVSVYGGGEERGLLFVIMEYFDGPNLADALMHVPAPQVRPIIAQIASAARFLEDSAFAHRDIKPENIGITRDWQTAKLLDLGVIRPLDFGNVTDEGEQRFFIATLQYSPPELLFRREDDSIEAWRAITFYQLGAVLHDLLMRKPLFQESSQPWGRLVIAVEREIPQITANGPDADLRLLAQNCLAKVARQRLETVEWDDFIRPKQGDPLDAARQSIARHRVAAAQTATIRPRPDDTTRQQMYILRAAIDSAVVQSIASEGLPRYSIRRVKPDDPYLIRVLFNPSTRHGLSQHFAFYCSGAVADASAHFLELTLWACVAPTTEALPLTPDPARAMRRIRGALIDHDIRANVLECLLLSYAHALATPPCKKPQPHWLSEGGPV